MDTDTIDDTAVSVDGNPGCDIEEMSNEKGTLGAIPFDKELMRELGSALIRLELDLACTSEKLVNMDLLMMHVAEGESDFEAFICEKEDASIDLAVKGLEFDVLSGIFDSEVREMDKFVCSLQSLINNAHERFLTHKYHGHAFSALEEKLHDTEESMKQSQEQVSDLMMQSAKFQRILRNSGRDKDVVIMEDGDFFSANARTKFQNSEQRDVLRMLEKSLARELDLEEKVRECTQALDVTKRRLNSSEQKILSLEEEMAAMYAQFLEADNASAILMGISKELIGQLQLCQLKINSAGRREGELNNRLQDSVHAMQKMEKDVIVLQDVAEKSSLESLAWKEKVNSLEEQLKTVDCMLLSGNASNSEQVKELQEKIFATEFKVEKAESECKMLAQSNKGLNEELDLLKGSGVSTEKVTSLENQLAEANTLLQQALATVDASEEKQGMLYESINDMEILIENLKSKVSKADALAESAEDKCIILSENNAELSEELSFLRGKVERLESSLQRSEETKRATAKDIDIRTKMITDLVMQLAVERERLHKQLYMLVNENRVLVDKLNVVNKSVPKSMKCEGGQNENGAVFSEDLTESVGSVKGNREVSDATEVKSSRNALNDEHECLNSKLETVRTIDAGRLSMKYVLSAMLTALLAVLAVCFLKPGNCPL